jgi:ketosteroid isomerase-like protein
MTDDRIAQIKHAENERASALVNADWAALAGLLSEDLVHIHATGLIDDKPKYLEGARTKLVFLKVERVSLDVRFHGELAIATGVLNQTLRIKGPETVVDILSATTQVWIPRDGRWVQSTFQATRIS